MFVGDITRDIAATHDTIQSKTMNLQNPTSLSKVICGRSAKHQQRHRLRNGWTRRSTVRQQTGAQAVTLDGMLPSENLVQAVEQVNNAVLMPTINHSECLGSTERTSTCDAGRDPDAAVKEAAAYLEVFSRPPPPAASPTPYYGLLGLAFIGLVTWIVLNVRDPILRAEVKKHRSDYLWVLPAGLAMTLLVALPFITGAALSLFAHANGEWTFVGLRHFADILFSRDWPITSPMSFYFTLAVTILWTVTNLFLHVGIGIAMALVLREPWIRMRGMWRALLIIPWAIPNYITALIWKTMFHVQFGAINALLTATVGGGEPVEVEWFGSFAMAFSANLITNTWLGFPFMMVVTLGALQSIPRDLEEAAIVDGASEVLIRHVVWPYYNPLLPAIIIDRFGRSICSMSSTSSVLVNQTDRLKFDLRSLSLGLFTKQLIWLCRSIRRHHLCTPRLLKRRQPHCRKKDEETCLSPSNHRRPPRTVVGHDGAIPSSLGHQDGSDPVKFLHGTVSHSRNRLPGQF